MDCIKMDQEYQEKKQTACLNNAAVAELVFELVFGQHACAIHLLKCHGIVFVISLASTSLVVTK